MLAEEGEKKGKDDWEMTHTHLYIYKETHINTKVHGKISIT